MGSFGSGVICVCDELCGKIIVRRWLYDEEMKERKMHTKQDVGIILRRIGTGMKRVYED